jgi:hypothetical protein
MHPTAEPIEALDGTPHRDEKGVKGRSSLSLVARNSTIAGGEKHREAH